MWPRIYAAEIIKAATKQERRRLLSEVPEHLQAIVEKHVVNHFALRKRDG